MLTAAARSVLAASFDAVADPNLFTSTTLFGQPGLYPDASPMAPADGAPGDDGTAQAAVASLGPAAAAAWGDAALEAVAPEPLARAAAAALAGTVAAPLLGAFLTGATPVRSLGVGPTASPGRVVGPPAGSPTEGARVVNDRYAAEDPRSVAPSVAHDLAWSGPGATRAEETVLHLVVALVHAQLVSGDPRLAHLGTELVRRQNSLVLPLLCSHAPGDPTLAVIAPGGAGTAPGGAPSMQTPDFWSIPFGPPGPPTPLPPAVTATLTAACGDPAALGETPRYDDDLARRLSAVGLAGALPLVDHLRVAVALGLVGAADLAAAAGLAVDEVGDAFGVADALACWADR